MSVTPGPAEPRHHDDPHDPDRRGDRPPGRFATMVEPVLSTWDRILERHPTWDPARILLGMTAVVAVAALCWVRFGSTPQSPAVLHAASESAVTLPTSLALAVSSNPDPTTSAPPTEVVVDVAGAVRQPGVVHVRWGGRVIDAITLAGGASPDADLARVNRARPLVDGDRVYVPRRGEDDLPDMIDGPGAASTATEGAPGTATAVTPGAGPVDLNTADAAQLESLPGIGPATAQAIIEHRTSIGRFTDVEELLDVRGIGDAKFARLRDLVTV